MQSPMAKRSVGGVELAMTCHMKIATANARFEQPEVNLGIYPGYAGHSDLLF